MTERSRTVAEREKSLQQSYKMFEANVEAEALKRFGQLEKVSMELRLNCLTLVN